MRRKLLPFYSCVGIVVVLMLGGFFYAFSSMAIYSPRVGVIHSLELELSTFHLLLEEFLIEDKSVSRHDIEASLARINDDFSTLLSGGVSVRGAKVPIGNNHDNLKRVILVQEKVNNLGILAMERIESRPNAIAGTKFDLEFDKLYHEILDAFGEIANRAHENISKCLQRFLAIQISTIVILAYLMSLIVRQYNRALKGAIVAKDESNKHEKEAILTKNEWEQTFDAVRDIIMILDLNMVIERVNHATCDMLDKPKEAIIGEKCCNLFRDIEFPCWGCRLKEVIETGVPVIYEVMHPSLKKAFMVSLFPIIEDGDVVKIVHMASDITDYKQIEERSSQSQKMEAVGRLTAGIAHDFNNLLTPIIGFSQLLARNLEKEENIHQIKTIEASAKRAAMLIDQLLSFSRKQKLNIDPCEVTESILEIISMLSKIIPGNIEIKTDFDDKPYLALVDASKLSQVIVNLITNSRYSMPDGGIIDIEVDSVDFDFDHKEQNLKVTAGRYIQLSISDTGCGIEDGIINSIFDPFFTTKNKCDGTGLGLATVYGIIKQHHGYIFVDSKVGEGSKFTMYLPKAEELIVAKKRPISFLPDDDFYGKETILVVDDEDLILYYTEEVLNRYGYNVLLADDGMSALERISETDNIDLIITDISMKNMGGMELFEKVQQVSPKTKFIFISGYAHDIKEFKDFKVDFIQKPLDTNKLLSMVKKVLN